MDKIEVVGLGAMNMDHLYKVERILEDGETVVQAAESFPGGSAANTIYGLAKLGVRTGFVGVVGDDADGKSLVSDFQAMEVDTRRLKIKRGSKTGAVLCLTDSAGHRSLYVSPGANSLLDNGDIDINYINQAGMLHLTSFADEKQLQVSREVVERLNSGVRLSFSPGAIYAAKGLTALKPLIKRADILFTNHDEIRQLTGEYFVRGAEICLKQGCRVVAVTLGKGLTFELGGKKVSAVCYIRDSRAEYVIEPVQDAASVTDTTGAGDAFATGFLYGYIKEKPLDECGHLGDLVARFKITKLGARPGFPTLGELARRYRELYSKAL